jgi:hypothetical protein
LILKKPSVPGGGFLSISNDVNEFINSGPGYVAALPTGPAAKAAAVGVTRSNSMMGAISLIA